MFRIETENWGYLLGVSIPLVIGLLNLTKCQLGKCVKCDPGQDELWFELKRKLKNKRRKQPLPKKARRGKRSMKKKLLLHDDLSSVYLLLLIIYLFYLSCRWTLSSYLLLLWYRIWFAKVLALQMTSNVLWKILFFLDMIAGTMPWPNNYFVDFVW